MSENSSEAKPPLDTVTPPRIGTDAAPERGSPSPIPSALIEQVVASLVATHGEERRAAAEAGVARVAAGWREEDGDGEAFKSFCVSRFLASAEDRRRLLLRLERLLERLRGHLSELGRELRRWSDLRGDALPAFDDLAARFDPAPDLAAVLHRQGIAHLARLHFDAPDLDTMLREGDRWDDERWAAARVAGAFGPRVPAEAGERSRTARQRAHAFVDGFHVPVGQLVDASGKRLFDTNRRLVAHWLIREQIRAGYDRPDGLARQRALAWVMGRTVDGSVPRSIMEGRAEGDWEPGKNTVAGKPPGSLVGPQRYAVWLALFEAERALDAHHPAHPTAMARAFEWQREIPLPQVEALLEQVLDAPERADLAAWVAHRVGRSLEAHDIYFDRVGGESEGADLEALVAQRYPDAAALEQGLPDVLRELGFPEDAADFYGRRVRVEIARGAGHASGPPLIESAAWLRTNARTDTQGLGWDGFDIAVHELGHNVEQLISSHETPRAALRGVPNAACSEAFAFLFQERARLLIGLPDANPARSADGTMAAEALAAWQIAGPAWVELQAWRWLYDGADAERDPESLRAEVLRLADAAWDRWYAPFFGPDPHHLLAAYQHMIAYPLYLSSYVIGHAIAHQIRAHVEGRDLAGEMRRMCGIGRRTPQAWLQQAVGKTLDATAMMRAGGRAATRLSSASPKRGSTPPAAP
jgi:hypothetical protein